MKCSTRGTGFSGNTGCGAWLVTAFRVRLPGGGDVSGVVLSVQNEQAKMREWVGARSAGT